MLSKSFTPKHCPIIYAICTPLQRSSDAHFILKVSYDLHIVNPSLKFTVQFTTEKQLKDETYEVQLSGTVEVRKLNVRHTRTIINEVELRRQHQNAG